MARASSNFTAAADTGPAKVSSYSGGRAQTAFWRVIFDGSQGEGNGKPGQAIDHKDTGARLGSRHPYDWHSPASLCNYGRVDPVGGRVRDGVFCHQHPDRQHLISKDVTCIATVTLRYGRAWRLTGVKPRRGARRVNEGAVGTL